ncbi:MAG: hypothetical protein JWM59_1460 [Verrucomicrobiales bacterium]|nr:hypothetical protein [Verrucomicrobiales bacterium]
MPEPAFPIVPALDRRSLLKVPALSAAATVSFGGASQALAQQSAAAMSVPGDPADPPARGTESDPSLVMPVHSPWPLVLTAPEWRPPPFWWTPFCRRMKNHPLPRPWGARVLNEWVSAPCPVQKKDLETVRGGLAWLSTESFNRFGTHYAKLSEDQKTALCGDICHIPKAKPEHLAGARFLAAFRDLCASGYCTTVIGFEDLVFTGNRPSPTYEWHPGKCWQNGACDLSGHSDDASAENRIPCREQPSDGGLGLGAGRLSG